MTDMYRQAITLSSLPVTGWYRYRDVFQILPPNELLKRPPAVEAHHPVIFQWKHPESTEPRSISGHFDIPKWVLDKDSAAEKAREILLVLGVLLNNRIFEYHGRQSWFVDLEETGSGTLDPKWGQELYTGRDFKVVIEGFSSIEGIPEVETVETNKYLNRWFITYDAVFDIPKDLTFLLDKFFALSSEDKKSFLSSCALFEQGIDTWGNYPSLSFVGFVSCLETLINVDNKDVELERCKECGQERHRVTHKFREFFLKYGNDSAEFKKYAMKIYKYRSKVVHTGELFNGEVMPLQFGSDARIYDDDFRRSVIRTCRICIVNWLLSRTNDQ